MSIINNEKKGSISVYFVLSIVLIISIVFSVTEIARMNCQKLYLQIATDASLDSMMSLYNRKLYEYYNIYGVEYREMDMLDNEYFDYIDPYFWDDERNVYINNWYTADIDEANIALDFELLIENTYFEKEILEYMKYKIIGKTIDFLGGDFQINNEVDLEMLKLQAKDLYNETKKSNLYNEVYERYFNFATDIKILESYAKKLPSYINKVNNNITTCRSVSSSGSFSVGESLVKKLNELLKSLNNLNTALNSYKSRMDEFRKVVEKGRDMYEEDKASNRYEYTDEINEFINDEFENFVKFVDENSEMNKSIKLELDESNDIISIVSQYKSDVENYVIELKNVEEDLDYARSQTGDEYDADYVNELKDVKRDIQDELSEYIKDIKDTFKDMKLANIDVEVSNANHSSEESLINKLINLKNGLVINFVLENEEIDKIDSNNLLYKEFDILSASNNVSLEKILYGEYELDKFNYYNKEYNAEETKSNSTALEVENLLNGKNSDIDNFKATINSILLMRIAMNVLHIYKSSEKRQMARTFTYTIFGGFSRLLAEVMFLLVISAWGTAQGIADVKKLLKNYKVNFMHDNSSWSIDIDNIFDVAGGDITTGAYEDDTGFALSYKDYLRILLFNTKQQDINSRMAGIIEKNIKKEESEFDFSKCIYSFNVNNNFTCNHFFTNLIFENAKDIVLYDEYSIKTSAYKSFFK